MSALLKLFGGIIEIRPVQGLETLYPSTRFKPCAMKGTEMDEVILKRFDKPDEIREFEKGKFETIKIGELVIGRATYQPGWKWSEHVSPLAGTPFCNVEHFGMVLSGKATAAMDGGEVYELGPGTVFYIPPAPHDSWVVGEEPYVSLHFLGADRYTKS
jgi:Cupin domain